MTTPETQVPLTLAEFAARPCAYNRDYVVVSILREGGERAQFRLSRGGAASLADELRGSIRTRPTVSEGDVERVARAIDPVLHEHAMAVISGKGDPDFTTRIARAAIAALSQPAPTIQPSAEGLAGELEALAKFAVPAPWQANLAPSMKYCSSVEYRSEMPQLSQSVCQVRPSEVLVGAPGLKQQNATAELIAALRNNLAAILTALKAQPSIEAVERPVAADAGNEHLKRENGNG